MLKFGSALVKLRKLNNSTQKQLADALYVSRSSYASWELDTHEIPLSKLFALTKIYKISLSDIIKLIEIENNEADGTNNIVQQFSSRQKKQDFDFSYLSEELADIKQLIKNTLAKD